MVLQVSTEQRIFLNFEYTKKKGTKNSNNFSLKIRPKLKIASFLCYNFANFL